MEWLSRPPVMRKTRYHTEWLATLTPSIPELLSPDRNKSRPLMINNTVFIVNMHSRFGLLDLTKALQNVSRKRIKFPNVHVAYTDTNSSVTAVALAYTKGKWVLCGTRADMEALRMLQVARLELQQYGIPVGLSEMTPVNVVVRTCVPFSIDLQRAIASKRLFDAEFIQGAFPGMVFRVRGIRVLAFRNGRLVLTGGTNPLDMYAAKNEAERQVSQFVLTGPTPDGNLSTPASRGGRGRGRGSRGGGILRNPSKNTVHVAEVSDVVMRRGRGRGRGSSAPKKPVVRINLTSERVIHPGDESDGDMIEEEMASGTVQKMDE